nr:unnamed protein product [Callosobruchus chinensis]
MFSNKVYEILNSLIGYIYTFTKSGALYEYHAPEHFQCNVCNKKYKYSHSLSRHKRYECGKEATFKCIAPGCPSKFTCDTCGKSYKHQGSFSRHKKYECQKAPTFGCDYCDYISKRRSDLKKHTKNQHTNSDCNSEELFEETEPLFNSETIDVFLDLQFTCATCGKKYKHSRSLRKHERFECQKEPQFLCVYCPYKAKLRGNLRKHIMVKHREEWTSGAAKIYVERDKKHNEQSSGSISDVKSENENE